MSNCWSGGLIFLISGCFAYELIASSPAINAGLGGLLPTPADRNQPGDAVFRYRHSWGRR